VNYIAIFSFFNFAKNRKDRFLVEGKLNAFEKCFFSSLPLKASNWILYGKKKNLKIYLVGDVRYYKKWNAWLIGWTDDFDDKELFLYSSCNRKIFLFHNGYGLIDDFVEPLDMTLEDFIKNVRRCEYK